MGIIKQKKLSEKIIDEIKRRIADGELKEGDKLPSQPEFATQLGVSRNSLREALNFLSHTGIIEQRPKVGTIIKYKPNSVMGNNFFIPLIGDAQTTIELIEFRLIIEIATVKKAVQNITKQEIKELGKLISAMDQSIKDRRFSDFMTLDDEYHCLIAKASKNRFLHQQIIFYNNLMGSFSRALEQFPDIIKRTAAHHENIYKGIRNKDLDKALTGMKTHLNDLKIVVEQM